MTQPQGALLVGSVNYDDAETTIRTAAEVLGPQLKRIPDGEVGKRYHWIMFQGDVLGQAEGIERVGDEPIWLGPVDARFVRVSDGIDPASIALPPLGYASAARESYAIFRRLRDEGVVAEGVRFQVSVPTPAAVVGCFFPADQRAAIEPVYRDALYREIEEIVDAIPHKDLAIQWDVAVEFQIIESKGYGPDFGGAVTAWWADVWAGLVARAGEQAAIIPEDIELGFHFCYGDANEQHFAQPADAANLVRFANAVVSASPRRIDWLHLPVPIERDDAEYFAPLASLELPEETELYLGLVHREDGTAGAQRRAAAAYEFVERFGVGTECGIGRAPAGTTEGILLTHAEVAKPW
ncbi:MULTISPECIES: hypothetical protein [unclassified Microbacterium]|uniref:hypothetical protein n=1 Tax=unclassified Microbacterium TaxID=2609290 RepID=UPI00214B4A51|nr:MULTISPECIES: hypothetical protein [unclassified Microbacterium]MCR2811291.1 hypothetical protein [Microbacterium sp. zg.B185]WIM19449.1 hypothetical protein QNO12_01165 [Microbacterium sp. zg-B185]